MKNMKYLLMLLCSAMFLTSCHSDDDTTSFPPAKASRTVMIYMSGENNLTYSSFGKFLNLDLQEMIAGSKSLSDDQRLLVFVDSLNYNSQHAGKPYIAEIHGGEVNILKQFDSDFYASDPSMFHEILSWMVTNAPAESYGLVLWGHATGWLVSRDTIATAAGAREASSGVKGGTVRRAYGQDKGTDVSAASAEKWMNITQMAKELAKLPKLEFIFADCCNMMCAEVGYELRNVTNYLIGSPAEIPGNGAPYNKIVPLLYGSGSQLYKSIIDTYYNYYLDDYKGDPFLDGYSVPLSVIDTKYMEPLAQATHDILDKFEDGYPLYPNEPNVGDIAFYLYDDNPVMYDMRAYIKRNTTATDFAAWDRVYSQAVPYYRMSLRWMTIYTYLELTMTDFDQNESLYGCVSMFIPRSEKNYLRSTYNYNKTCNNFAWNRAMQWTRFGWN